MDPTPDVVRRALAQMPDGELLRRWRLRQYTEEAEPLIRGEMESRGLSLAPSDESARSILMAEKFAEGLRLKSEPRFLGAVDFAAWLWRTLTSSGIFVVALALWLVQVQAVDAGHAWAEGLGGYAMIWLAALMIFVWFGISALLAGGLVELVFVSLGQPLDPGPLHRRALWLVLSVVCTVAVMALLYLLAQCSGGGDPDAYDRALRRPI